jgi:hypothetical protein
MTKLSEAAFDVLVERAGLTLTAAQRAEIYRGYGAIEILLERVRRPRDLGSEPATIFTLEKNGAP